MKAPPELKEKYRRFRGVRGAPGTANLREDAPPGPQLESHASEHPGTIYAGVHPIYIFALGRKFGGKHLTINYSETCGIGSTITNSIEKAFSVFERRPGRDIPLGFKEASSAVLRRILVWVQPKSRTGIAIRRNDKKSL